MVQAIVWLTILLFVLELRRTGLDLVAAEASSGVVSEEKTVEVGGEGEKDLEGEDMEVEEMRRSSKSHRPSLKPLMKKVWVKMAGNPNSYACTIGFAWAFVAKRYFYIIRKTKRIKP